MLDPLDSSLWAQIAYGLAKGVLGAVAEDGPRIAAGIVGAIRAAMADTEEQAPPAPPQQIAAAQSVVAHAQAAGKMPPIVIPP